MQSYSPYRRAILSPEELRAFNQLAPRRMVVDTLRCWAVIALAWWAVATWPVWWVVALAVPVIGTRYYALSIIGHDGLHRRLFGKTAHSDLWNDLLILGPIGAVTRLNRRNHMAHHRDFALPNDPDAYKYDASLKETPLQFLFALTGLPFVLRVLANIFSPSQQAHGVGDEAETSASADPAETFDPTEPGYSPRDLAIILGWQSGLIVGLSWAIGWWAYPLVWVLPVYVFQYTADFVRTFSEHSIVGAPEVPFDRRLISYTSNPIERMFFAPLNMNLHVAHHLWPGIPYYNLPVADSRIRGSKYADALEWRSSYMGHLLAYERALRGRAPE